MQQVIERNYMQEDNMQELILVLAEVILILILIKY